jgi:hypothetical protein
MKSIDFITLSPPIFSQEISLDNSYAPEYFKGS